MLLARLSDGRFHSGQSLADDSGISRTAIWKHIQSLRAAGVNIYCIRGKGYCLAEPLELLNETTISKLIQTDIRNLPGQLEVFFEIESTNQYLLNKLSTEPIHGHVVLAEFQTAGRGRRGNHWFSPIGSGLCLSIGWRFDVNPASLMGLSLASGVAVLRALGKFEVKKTGLKWPNDIICNGAKLGGILLESRVEAAGTCDVVLGLGLNLRLPHEKLDNIEQPVTDIAQNCDGIPSRNELAAAVISELIIMFREYAQSGFTPFIESWRQSDSLAGKRAQLTLADKQLVGEVLGIDDNGLLQMQIDGGVKKFTSGELSIRALK